MPSISVEPPRQLGAQLEILKRWESHVLKLDHDSKRLPPKSQGRPVSRCPALEDRRNKTC